MKNQKLTQAKINAYDEFYTQRKTIEKELKYYTEQFRNKVIYLNTVGKIAIATNEIMVSFTNLEDAFVPSPSGLIIININ